MTQIDAGYAHTLLLTGKGDVWTFGCGLFGQMGNGENKKVRTPWPIMQRQLDQTTHSLPR